MLLYDEQGNEVEALTKEEAEALKPNQELVTNLLQELGVEKGEDLKEKIKELKEGQDPNWKAARGQIKTLENVIATLKSQGKTVDESGKIVDSNEKGLSAEEIRNEAAKSARQELINEKIEDTLSAFGEEQQKVIKHYFSKLSAGEELTLKSVDKFLTDAVKASGITEGEDKVKNSLNRIGSSSSNPSNNNKNFADTDSGKAVLELMGIKEIKKEDKK